MGGSASSESRKRKKKSCAPECAGKVAHDFPGLIQHSFALRVPDELKSQYTRKDISDPREFLSALLTVPAVPGGDTGFRPMPVGEMGIDPEPKQHSLIVGSEFTDIVGQTLPFAQAGRHPYPWPLPFEWANSGCGEYCSKSCHDERCSRSDCGRHGSKPCHGERDRHSEQKWDRCIPAARDGSGRVQPNDYLIVRAGSPSAPPSCADPAAVSWLLCQLLAHRRSRLFGWSLERRIVNVLLPHALLGPEENVQGDNECPCNEWIVQPLLSLFLTNTGRGFRSIFSLTLLMIPVKAGDDRQCAHQPSPSDGHVHPPFPAVAQRAMSKLEIQHAVDAGWNVATSPAKRPLFTVGGPLCDYLTALDPSLLARLDLTPGSDCRIANGKPWGPLRLRETAEAIAMATALRLVAGPCDRADPMTARKLGEKVLVALSSSRASSVVVVDKKFERCETEESRSAGCFPGSLEHLMEAIAEQARIAPRKKYRLDRAFFDGPDYAIGVLPADRCIVVTADPCTQNGQLDSALLEAGWLAYMTIGAATATGMMRSIYHEIEQVDRSKPRAIADIEREVVVDLHEIYDLDITWEPYRERYRMLRERFGITRDYESLQNKLAALSRESSTRFEDTAQKRLILLTAAIVLLTLVVVVVTVLAK